MGAIYLFLMNADFSVKSQKKVLMPELSLEHYFGSSITNVGDWDGNGTVDLVVGSYWDGSGDPQESPIYLLLLNSDLSVNKTILSFSFSGANPGDLFGPSVETMGDLQQIPKPNRDRSSQRASGPMAPSWQTALNTGEIMGWMTQPCEITTSPGWHYWSPLGQIVLPARPCPQCRRPR